MLKEGIPMKKKSAASVKPKVNFNPKLQKELIGLISDNSKTVLEGVRAKVFSDRYSLKDADGHAVEEVPEQMWARVSAGIGQTEKTSVRKKSGQRNFTIL